MPSKNVNIQKKARDRWYCSNKEKQIARQYERRKELKEWLLSYKRGLSCEDCKVSFEDHPEWCDFHHNDPAVKEGKVADLIRHSKDAFLKEIKKCTALCANCHRTRHKDYT